MPTLEEFIEHVGVKGMHWGIRKKIKREPNRISSDHKRISEIRKKKTPQLTNKQLQDHNTRRNLEQNFNRMNPSKIKKGNAHIKGIIAGATAAIGIHKLITSKEGKMFFDLGKKHLATQAMKRAMRKHAGDQLKLF